MDISQQTIEELRQKHGKIYRTNYNNSYFIFRALTVGEFEYLTIAHSLEHEDSVAKKIIVWPENIDIDSMPAGFVSAILNEALEVSNFADAAKANSLIEEARAKSTMVIPMIKSFILAARPMVSNEYLNSLTFDQLISELVIAEKILEIISNVTNPSVESVSFTIPDPEEIAKEEATKDPVKERLIKALEGIQ